MSIAAPERIWAMRYYGKGDEGFWDTTHSPHAKEDAQHEYILHTREALAQSPLVQAMIAEAVEAEREACAAIADNRSAMHPGEPRGDFDDGWICGAKRIAAAIRRRG